ncbi:MAG: hypothetical protein AAGD38_00800 [Acidobacteriota bacterium]
MITIGFEPPPGDPITADSATAPKLPGELVDDYLGWRIDETHTSSDKRDRIVT